MDYFCAGVRLMKTLLIFVRGRDRAVWIKNNEQVRLCNLLITLLAIVYESAAIIRALYNLMKLSGCLIR